MPAIFSRNKSRSKARFSASKKLSSARQRAASSGVRDGFPVNEPFASLQAIRDYLSGDRITCLICGNDKIGLATHLKVHGMTADTYKAQYNIPLSYALIGADALMRAKENGRTLKERKVGIHRMSDEERRAATVKGSQTPQRASPGKSMVSSAEKKRYTDNDFLRLADLMIEKDQCLHHVIRSTNGPRKFAVYKKLREDGNFRAAVDAAYERLSFTAQASSQRLGKRFSLAACSLRAKGMSYEQIGEQLGVDTMSVFNHLNGKIGNARHG